MKKFSINFPDHPLEPIELNYVPHYHEMNFDSYLSAYLEYKKKYKKTRNFLNKKIKIKLDNSFIAPNHYTFYMYELQDLAFKELLNLISNYKVQEFHIITKGLIVEPNAFEYFLPLLQLLGKLEEIKALKGLLK